MRHGNIRRCAVASAVSAALSVVSAPAARADDVLPPFRALIDHVRMVGANAADPAKLAELGGLLAAATPPIPDAQFVLDETGRCCIEVDMYYDKTAYGITEGKGSQFAAYINDRIHAHHAFLGLSQYVEWTGSSSVYWLGTKPYNADKIMQLDQFYVNSLVGDASISWPPSVELTDRKDGEFRAPERVNQWYGTNHYATVRLKGHMIYSAMHETRGSFLFGADVFFVQADYGRDI